MTIMVKSNTRDSVERTIFIDTTVTVLSIGPVPNQNKDPNPEGLRADNWTLQWRHNEHDSVSNHQPHDCLHNRLFGPRSKKTKLRVTGLCAGNSLGTVEFPAQMASNAENVSIWWRHHEVVWKLILFLWWFEWSESGHNFKHDTAP